MKYMIWALGIVLVAIAAGAIYVRTAPSDPARWHVDPLVVAKPSYPGHYLVRPQDGDDPGPVFDTTPEMLLARLHELALATPRVEVLAGSPDEGLVTYVARSRVVGFPDYISVRALPAGGGQSRLAVFARLRFGSDDLGVNRARVQRWFSELGGETPAPDG